MLLALIGLTGLAGTWCGLGARSASQADWYTSPASRTGDNRMLASAETYNRTHWYTPGDGGVDYARQLNNRDGVMGVIDYPRLGIRLTIRHGSDTATLAQGAGHYPGTALPVGGVNTRTVITAHRGGVAPMFTRLDEARPGDVFHLTAGGRTIAYRVIDMKVIQPDDTMALAPVKGKDLATLLTCTPYGVNTQRLMVTGERTPMPGWGNRKPTDNQPKLIWLGIGGLWILCGATAFWHRMVHDVDSISLAGKLVGGSHAPRHRTTRRNPTRERGHRRCHDHDGEREATLREPHPPEP